jgi:hypothetical protein
MDEVYRIGTHAEQPILYENMIWLKRENKT